MKKYLLIPIILAAAFIGLLPKAVSAQTLYQCFQENKMPWTTVKQRAAVAAENGVWQYRGTAAQNKLLASRLCSDTFGFSAVTGYKSSLSLPMTSSQTSLTVVSLQTKDLHTITMSDLGSFVFLTLEPGGAKEELVKCTGISGSQFTGCTRGLAFYGTSTAAVAANAKTHNASSVVVLSNVHFVYEQFLDVNADKIQTVAGDKIVSGTWTFQQTPLSTSTTVTDPLGLITLGQLTSVSSTGCANASTAVRGCVETATDNELTASVVTSTGGTGAQLVVTPVNFQNEADHHFINEYVPGEAITQSYPVVYMSSSGKFFMAHANVQAEIDRIFAVAYVGSSGTSTAVPIYGVGSHIKGTNLSGLTPGQTIYLGDDARGSATPGTIRKIIGVAVKSDSWIFNPTVETPTKVPGTSSTIPLTTASGTLALGWIATSTGSGINGDFLRSSSTGPYYDSLGSAGGASTTATRVIDTIYRNTSTLHNGKTLLIYITVADSGGSGTNGQATLTMDNNASPTTVVGRWDLNNNGGAGVSNSSRYTISLLVPTGWYWKVTNVANASIDNVYEMEL